MVCLPSFLSLPLATSLVFDVERTTSMEYKFFPILWNCYVTIQALSYSHQSVLELHECTLGIFGIFAVLEPRLVTSFIHVLNPIIL